MEMIVLGHAEGEPDLIEPTKEETRRAQSLGERHDRTNEEDGAQGDLVHHTCELASKRRYTQYNKVFCALCRLTCEGLEIAGGLIAGERRRDYFLFARNAVRGIR